MRVFYNNNIQHLLGTYHCSSIDANSNIHSSSSLARTQIDNTNENRNKFSRETGFAKDDNGIKNQIDPQFDNPSDAFVRRFSLSNITQVGNKRKLP